MNVVEINEAGASVTFSMQELRERLSTAEYSIRMGAYKLEADRFLKDVAAARALHAATDPMQQ